MHAHVHVEQLEALCNTVMYTYYIPSYLRTADTMVEIATVPVKITRQVNLPKRHQLAKLLFFWAQICTHTCTVHCTFVPCTVVMSLLTAQLLSARCPSEQTSYKFPQVVHHLDNSLEPSTRTCIYKCEYENMNSILFRL